MHPPTSFDIDIDLPQRGRLLSIWFTIVFLNMVGNKHLENKLKMPYCEDIFRSPVIIYEAQIDMKVKKWNQKLFLCMQNGYHFVKKA